MVTFLSIDQACAWVVWGDEAVVGAMRPSGVWTFRALWHARQRYVAPLVDPATPDSVLPAIDYKRPRGSRPAGEGLSPGYRDHAVAAAYLGLEPIRKVGLLLECFKVGSILAYKPGPDGTMETVPTVDWAHGWGPARYPGVVVREIDLKKRFGPRDSHAASSIGAETRCKGWLVELMKGSDNPGKRVIQAEAKSKFGVTGRAFGRSWTAALAESGVDAWSKPGPKSKR